MLRVRSMAILPSSRALAGTHEESLTRAASNVLSNCETRLCDCVTKSYTRYSLRSRPLRLRDPADRPWGRDKHCPLRQAGRQVQSWLPFVWRAFCCRLDARSIPAGLLI